MKDELLDVSSTMHEDTSEPFGESEDDEFDDEPEKVFINEPDDTMEGSIGESSEPPFEEPTKNNEDNLMKRSFDESINNSIVELTKNSIQESLIPCDDNISNNQSSNMEADDNRYFLLSLLPTMSTLPKRLNTKCRLELMQVINKYEELAYKLGEQHNTVHVKLENPVSSPSYDLSL